MNLIALLPRNGSSSAINAASGSAKAPGCKSSVSSQSDFFSFGIGWPPRQGVVEGTPQQKSAPDPAPIFEDNMLNYLQAMKHNKAAGYGIRRMVPDAARGNM
jgi:hypothetical protein